MSALSSLKIWNKLFVMLCLILYFIFHFLLFTSFLIFHFTIQLKLFDFRFTIFASFINSAFDSFTDSVFNSTFDSFTDLVFNSAFASFTDLVFNSVIIFRFIFYSVLHIIFHLSHYFLSAKLLSWYCMYQCRCDKLIEQSSKLKTIIILISVFRWVKRKWELFSFLKSGFIKYQVMHGA